MSNVQDPFSNLFISFEFVSVGFKKGCYSFRHDVL